MGFFDLFKKKIKDSENKSNSKELNRLKEIYNIKSQLGLKLINTIKEINNGDFLNGDSSHLLLLDELKKIDDQIQKYMSEEKEIKLSDKSEIILSEGINNLIPNTDMKPVPMEVWEQLRKCGK